MSKLSFLLLIFIAAGAAVIGKLFLIQILAADRYESFKYLKTKKILPHRGQIFDRNRQALALNQTTYLLYAEPQKIEDKAAAADKLEKVLKLGIATLEAKLKSDKLWMPLASGVAKADKEKLMDLKIAGIGVTEEERRFYPEASLSAHLLGFVGRDAEAENIGYFGIEGYYEKDLAGLPGILKTERDLFGRPIFIGVQDEIKGEDGRELMLTLDGAVQALAKEKLSQGMIKYGAKEGCVIVADPYRLEIVALTCLPDFDPHHYADFSESYFKNPAISNLYEPGSIFKPLIMSAALQEKAVKQSDTYDETGPITIGKYEIQTWNDQYEGQISLTRILEKSSNVGLVWVGEKLGRKKTLSYLEKFGLGEKTGIDLQGEVSGRLKDTSQWRSIDYATVTFGQGIGVTQIQMLRVFAALINGGWLMRPYVVSSLRSEAQEDTIAPEKSRRVIDESSSKQIRQMLESTVVNGDAKWARPAGYRIGGKTGTAQIPVEGRYDATKTIASFTGFAPVDRPKFIVLVTLREPSSSPWGSETAAPLFFDLARELFVYYNIAPD